MPRAGGRRALSERDASAPLDRGRSIERGGAALPPQLHNSTAHALGLASVWAWGLGEAVLRLRSRGGVDRFEWTLAAVAGCVGLGVGIAFLATYRGGATIGGGWVVFGLGELLFLAGLVLRYWAVLTLGRFFKVTVSIQAGHRVVCSGPYRHVRHPSYTGLLVILFGLGLMLGTWLGLAALIVLPLVGTLIRIRVEEAVLLEALGSEYADYAATTRRLIPGVW